MHQFEVACHESASTAMALVHQTLKSYLKSGFKYNLFDSYFH